jgi:hypothetical protein
MGVNEDLQLVAVHTHINLVGWASLALFGVIYLLYPELAASRLALVHFWLSAPSAAVFPVGIYLAQVHQIHAVVIATSLLWLLGALVFWWLQGWRLCGRRQPQSYRQVGKGAAIGRRGGRAPLNGRTRSYLNAGLWRRRSIRQLAGKHPRMTSK